MQMEVVQPFTLENIYHPDKSRLKSMIKIWNTFLLKLTSEKELLISCPYNLHLQLKDRHLTHVGKGLSSLSNKYDNYIWMGHFNAEVSNNLLDDFCEPYNLRILSKKLFASKTR